jgi:hypothetical protein
MATLESEAVEDKTQAELDCLSDRKMLEFLDAQRKRWRTSCGKAQRMESQDKRSACLRVVSRNTPKYRNSEVRLEDETRSDVTHANTESRDDQSKFRIISTIERLVPGVKRLNERTHQAYQQEKHRDKLGSSGKHGTEYTTQRQNFVSPSMRCRSPTWRPTLGIDWRNTCAVYPPLEQGVEPFFP